uniref:Uncharacterized protein n=1 Tax=Sus scrofa TaxID=9823 RepID=A0A8D1PHQ9_PIG
MCLGSHALESVKSSFEEHLQMVYYKLRQMSQLAPCYFNHNDFRASISCLNDNCMADPRDIHFHALAFWAPVIEFLSHLQHKFWHGLGKILPHSGMIAPSTSFIIGIIILSNGSREVFAFPSCCAFSLMGFKNKQQGVPKVKEYLESWRSRRGAVVNESD